MPERVHSISTTQSLVSDLRHLGVQPGQTLLVHTSLSALGWVCGGPVTVVQALLNAVGPTGTIMMPTFSSSYSEPSYWCNPPAPREFWETIRATMPAFDPVTTPTRGMGATNEVFRTWPGTLRSTHPQSSFAAHGPNAQRLLQHTSLSGSFGEESPLGELYRLCGSVLLLGVGHGNNTSLHLAEVRAQRATDTQQLQTQGSPVCVDGQRMWVEFEDYDYDDEHFVELGAAFEKAQPQRVHVGPVGVGKARLMEMKPLVDFGTSYLNEIFSNAKNTP